MLKRRIKRGKGLCSDLEKVTAIFPVKLVQEI